MSGRKQARCGGKQRHATKGEARAHAQSLVSRGAVPWQLNVYRCGYCKSWHVGHLEGLKRRR